MVYGQKKIDLDKYHLDVTHIALPKFVVQDIEKRTFQCDLKINFKHDDFFNREPASKIKLPGFTLSNAIPTVKVEVTLEDVSFYTVDKIERVVEVKDKAGVVVSKKYYYKAVSRYKCNGKYMLMGPSSGSNGAAEQVDAGSLNTELTRETAEFDSYSKAYEQFNSIRPKLLEEVKNEYVNNSANFINKTLTYHYGLLKHTYTDHFWLLDTKAHPENEKHQALKGTLKLALAKVSATESLDDFRKEIEPILAYFEECKTKYPEDSKKDIKMRFASFYNKMTLYYIAEMPQEAIKEAEGLILNDYDTSDGTTMIRLVKSMEESFKTAGVKTRHFKI